MITKLHINNFKSHKDTLLELSNLTLLCGQNGVGKSSIVQSLLLLRQTYRKGILSEGIDLNLPLVEIGNALDALYMNAQENFVGINISETNGQNWLWQFKFDDTKSNSTFLDIIAQEGDLKFLKNLSLFNKNFQYLSAARLSPRESYPKNDYEVEKNYQLSLEKGQGELVAHFLYHYGKVNIESETLLNTGVLFKDLLSQTTAWEREISKNINVKVEEIGKGYEIKYSFDVEEGFPTNDFRSENVGFGVSYVLPIIVAILSMPKDGLIILENPEAHLHPHGQAKLAELICLAAQTGIQVIVETHSDHIINGCLVACKKEQINADNIKIYYFNRDEKMHASKAIEVPVHKGGKIKNPPIGFFDQIATDRKYLMGF